MQEWWDSLFAKYNNDGNSVSAAGKTTVTATSARPSSDIQLSGAANGWPHDVNEDDDTPTSSNQRNALVGSTAAVLRLSNALQRAPVSTTHSDTISNASPSCTRKIPPPTLPKGCHVNARHHLSMRMRVTYNQSTFVEESFEL